MTMIDRSDRGSLSPAPDAVCRPAEFASRYPSVGCHEAGRLRASCLLDKQSPKRGGPCVERGQREEGWPLSISRTGECPHSAPPKAASRRRSCANLARLASGLTVVCSNRSLEHKGIRVILRTGAEQQRTEHRAELETQREREQKERPWQRSIVDDASIYGLSCVVRGWRAGNSHANRKGLKLIASVSPEPRARGATTPTQNLADECGFMRLEPCRSVR